MAIDVSDVRSNPQDQIFHAASVIGRSEHCRRVFSAIYKGKKKRKTIAEIENLTSLPRIRVLQEAGKLGNNHIVRRVKIGKEWGYEKDPFYTQNKNKILKLAGNKKAMSKFPTKINPRNRTTITYVPFPKKQIDVKQITIDDIDSFSLREI